MESSDDERYNRNDKQRRRSRSVEYKKMKRSKYTDETQHRSKWDSPTERRRNRSRSREKDYRRVYHKDRSQYRREDDDYHKKSRNDSREDHYNDRYKTTRDTRNQRQDRSNRKSRSQSPLYRENRQSKRNRSDDKNGKSYEWGQRRDTNQQNSTSTNPTEKEKPDFGLSGALTAETNKVNGIVVKYSEPPEARKPKRRWRLYPFKGETALPTLHIHRQSCFLVGRDRKVVDLAVDHPSCSKQHAALQYRLVPFERVDGSQGKRVRPYIIDLDSANGTFLNNKPIVARKYYELIEKDVLKFGFSTREYVLLHENSKEDQEDDDVVIKQEPEDEPEGPNP